MPTYALYLFGLGRGGAVHFTCLHLSKAEVVTFSNGGKIHYGYSYGSDRLWVETKSTTSWFFLCIFIRCTAVIYNKLRSYRRFVPHC